ncbi:hypothetical protein GCM10011490_13860 [Pseudoclavibacter endophyticus]|uniref:Monovalent cation/H(+) antiporter subunit G n=1 Tax=Pseudoclavibacter endophyticus TaxID=1778590 RepID=A0A6H9WK30_9MICO|nr:monovalent cation/H(+) antiporter subunit G [Pseudoclavibacter endophyticus]KAB1649216.1 monovalent cation/H(+) antiporter subunit G [Pseudoclavibacter endophyticus]GGA64431.1 hypothetical protein GCM10011490_13860 [Pseudoclavibacter endophyticus]
MSFDDVLDLASAVLVLIGAFLSFAAGLGLLRFSDLIMRMHAQTKPQIFGLLCILLGIAIQQTNAGTVLFLVPIMFFQMLTTPVAAATLARGGYRNWHFPKDELHVDALASAIELAERERAEGEQVDAGELEADAAGVEQPEAGMDDAAAADANDGGAAGRAVGRAHPES